MIDNYLMGHFRNTKVDQWRRMGILRGLLARIRSTSLIWCLCDSIMSRKAVGRRSFSSSDLGYEKATATTTRSCSFSPLFGLALHHISVYFFCSFSAFSHHLFLLHSYFRPGWPVSSAASFCASGVCSIWPRESLIVARVVYLLANN